MLKSWVISLKCFGENYFVLESRVVQSLGEVYGECARVPEINMIFRSFRTTFNIINILVDKYSYNHNYTHLQLIIT